MTISIKHTTQSKSGKVTIRTVSHATVNNEKNINDLKFSFYQFRNRNIQVIQRRCFETSKVFETIVFVDFKQTAFDV